QLNFCPSVFTLEPGEFVHINKGRLHAFRKEDPLPHEDPGSVCVSVAWDWVYKGVSQEGCRGEMACALRCASDNRRFGVVSLAPVETCLLQVAKASLASFRVRSRQEPGRVPHQAPASSALTSPPPPLSGKKRKAAGAAAPTEGEEEEKTGDKSGGSTAATADAATAVGGAVGNAKSCGLSSASPSSFRADNGAVAHASVAASAVVPGGSSSSACPSPPPAAAAAAAPPAATAAMKDGEGVVVRPTNIGGGGGGGGGGQEHAAVTRALLSRLLALVPEGIGDEELGAGVVDALRAIDDPTRDEEEEHGDGSSTGALAGGGGGGGGRGRGSGESIESPESLPSRGAAGVAKEEEKEIRRSALPSMGGGRSKGKGKGKPAAATTMTATTSTMTSGGDGGGSGGRTPKSSPRRSPTAAGPARCSSAPRLPPEAAPAAVAAAATAAAATQQRQQQQPAAITSAPNGLGSWIPSPKRGFDDIMAEAAASAAGGGATPVREATAMVAAAASAEERRPRGAMAAARLAAAAALSAVQHCNSDERGGGDGGESAAVGLERGGGDGRGDLGVLMALAPMLEELTARQLRDYGLQAKAAEKREAAITLNPSRPGKRKLGPAAAKARDAQTVQLMAKMVKPLKDAVGKVEVDTSIPTFLEKINPFSSDGESFNCASCKAEIFNAYLHCYGCETLLSRDLTLCLACHAAGRFGFSTGAGGGCTDQHHCPGIPERTLEQRERMSRSQRSHGVFPASKCDCKEPACRQCHLCVACACDCHERFQLRYRFEHP
ncbi:unnamed protein product, partial [Ectocarpus sp. 12 AP-2014]